MKRQANETNDHLRHRIFIARTAMVHKHQREKAEKAKRPMDFDLKWLREEVLCALTVVERRSCRYCRDQLTVRNFSLDHRVPTARGGSWSRMNVQIVCLKCNGAKGSLTSSEFQQLRDVLGSWPTEARADVLRRLRAGGRALSSYFKNQGDVAKPTLADTLVGAREFV